MCGSKFKRIGCKKFMFFFFLETKNKHFSTLVIWIPSFHPKISSNVKRKQSFVRLNTNVRFLFLFQVNKCLKKVDSFRRLIVITKILCAISTKISMFVSFYIFTRNSCAFPMLSSSSKTDRSWLQQPYRVSWIN